MTEPSPRYFAALERTKRHHAIQRKTWSGNFTWKLRKKRIKPIIERLGITSILDYGCGQGKQYQRVDENGVSLEQFWGIETTKYDPGVPQYSAEPIGKFDMVICVQVLGSIPKSDLPWVVDRLYSFATKAVFVAERLGIPNKKVHEDMKDEMPYGMSSAEWMGFLGRPGHPVKLICAFRNDPGFRGWRLIEPEDQG